MIGMVSSAPAAALAELALAYSVGLVLSRVAVTPAIQLLFALKFLRGTWTQQGWREFRARATNCGMISIKVMRLAERLHPPTYTDGRSRAS